VPEKTHNNTSRRNQMDDSPKVVKFRGHSGKEYSYLCYHVGEHFKELPGNYIFAKRVQSTGFIPVYIGQSENMGDHFYNSCRSMPCIYHMGGHYVCVNYDNKSKEEREAEAWDLMTHWKPQCNVETKIKVAA
jgi:hypothetical protein